MQWVTHGIYVRVRGGVIVGVAVSVRGGVRGNVRGYARDWDWVRVGFRLWKRKKKKRKQTK